MHGDGRWAASMADATPRHHPRHLRENEAGDCKCRHHSPGDLPPTPTTRNQALPAGPLKHVTLTESPCHLLCNR